MTIDAPGLDLLFKEARTHNKWHDKTVSDETLHELYDILKFGPTSANSSPARFVFIRTKEGKEKLAPALSSGNLEKTMSAPVSVIVAYDPKFFEKLPPTVPAQPGCDFVVHQQRRAGGDHGVPQWHAAGRLSDDRRAFARAGYRCDVGL